MIQVGGQPIPVSRLQFETLTGRGCSFGFPGTSAAGMYRYDVDEGARLIFATFEGEVSDADLFDYLAHMLSHTRYGSGWGSLIDLTSAASTKLTTAGVQRMRALPMYMEERLQGARAAILVAEASPAHQMAKMYASMGKPGAYPIAVFTSREEAMRWLAPERKG